MFASMRQRYYWRNMYKDVEETVRQCAPCAKNRVKERRKVSLMKLFPANEPLEFIAIDTWPLPEDGPWQSIPAGVFRSLL
jgi:hypothetical protein